MNKIKLLIIALCLILPIPAVATGDWFTMAAGSGDSGGGCATNTYTNLVVYSRDIPSGITAANWAQSGTIDANYNQVGIEGATNTASILTDNAGGAYESVQQDIVIPNDSNVNVVRIFIGKDTIETRFPEIQFIMSGGGQVSCLVGFNTKTGATALRGGTPTLTVNSYNDNYWELLISLQNNSSGNTNARIVVLPALGILIGVANTSAVGSIIVGDVELYANNSNANVSGICPDYND